MLAGAPIGQFDAVGSGAIAELPSVRQVELLWQHGVEVLHVVSLLGDDGQSCVILGNFGLCWRALVDVGQSWVILASLGRFGPHSG